MVNKLKIHIALTLLVIGLVFMGLGCTGEKNGSSTPGENTSSLIFTVRRLMGLKCPAIGEVTGYWQVASSRMFISLQTP